MYKKISVLALGLEKKHFQEKFENYYNEFKNLNYILSFSKIPNSFSISKLDWIDSSKLYKINKVFEAYHLSKKSTLDSNFLSKMYECEHLFNSTLDRCSTETRSQNENNSYFLDLLLFFKSFFELKKDITHIFFPSTPHFPVDIVLFYVSKYFSIKSIILNRTDFDNKFFFREDWKLMHPFKIDYKYYSLKKIDFNKKDGDSNFIEYSKKLNEKAKKNFQVDKNPINLLFNYFKLLKISINYYKGRKASSIFYLNKKTSWLDILIVINKRFKKDRFLKILYRKLTKEVDLNKEFVFFPLHFQPERSTDPEGLHFSNQLTAINLLRESLPSNVFLYIKEHPRQFDNQNFPDLRKNLYRDSVFYKTICNLKNTKLVDINVDSNLLIEKAKAVVTLTGSSGWQAIQKLKPAIIFGYPWYSSFKGSYHIKTKSDIQKVIIKINKTKNFFTKKDVEQYVCSIENKLFDAYIGPFYFKGDKNEYRNIIKQFSFNLNRFIIAGLKK